MYSDINIRRNIHAGRLGDFNPCKGVKKNVFMKFTGSGIRELWLQPLIQWFCTLLCQGGDFSVIKSFPEHSRPSSGIDREGVFLIRGLIPGGGRIWREAYPEWGLSRDVGEGLCLGLGPPRGDCSSTRWEPFLLTFERQRKQGLVNMFQEAAILRALLLFL